MRVRERERERERERDSQHEVLLPAGLASAHGDGRALDILNLQRHVAVELFWRSERKEGVTTQYIFYYSLLRKPRVTTNTFKSRMIS